MPRPKGAVNKGTIEIANQIWDLCAEYGRTGLTKREICDHLEITEPQFGTALRFIKDEFQEEREQPIVYMPQTYRYVFNASEKDARDYGKWTLNRWRTQIIRSKHYVQAVELKFGESRRTERLRLHTELLLNSIEEMLDSVGVDSD